MEPAAPFRLGAVVARMLGLVADYDSDGGGGGGSEEGPDATVGGAAPAPPANPRVSAAPICIPLSDVTETPNPAEWFAAMPTVRQRKRRVVQLPTPPALSGGVTDGGEDVRALEHSLLERRLRRQEDRPAVEGDGGALGWLPPPKRRRPTEETPQELRPTAVASAKPTAPAKTIRPARFTFSAPAAAGPRPPPLPPSLSPPEPSDPLPSAASLARPTPTPAGAAPVAGPMPPPGSPFSPEDARASAMPQHLAAIMRDMGGGRVVDISAEDLMGPAAADPEAVAFAAVQSAKLRIAKAGEQPTQLMKRRHQLGFLAQQADLSELDLDHRSGRRVQAKRATAARYGW